VRTSSSMVGSFIIGSKSTIVYVIAEVIPKHSNKLPTN